MVRPRVPSLLLLGGVCLLARLLPVSSAQAPVEVPTFAWDYASPPANAEGFQLMRCEATALTSRCDNVDGISGLIPLTTHTVSDATGAVGHRYCWGVRTSAREGPNSDVSNLVCLTLTQSTPVPPNPPPLAAPTHFEKVP